jgi:hypothetical protein
MNHAEVHLQVGSAYWRLEVNPGCACGRVQRPVGHQQWTSRGHWGIKHQHQHDTRCINTFRASTRCINSVRQHGASTRLARQLVTSTRCINTFPCVNSLHQLVRASTRRINSVRQLVRASTRCVNSVRQLGSSTRCVNSVRQLGASTRCVNSVRQLGASTRLRGMGRPFSQEGRCEPLVGPSTSKPHRCRCGITLTLQCQVQ